jgi:hypothetical protein
MLLAFWACCTRLMSFLSCLLVPWAFFPMVGFVFYGVCDSAFSRLSWPTTSSQWQLLLRKLYCVIQGHCVSNVPKVSPSLPWLWWWLASWSTFIWVSDI